MYLIIGEKFNPQTNLVNYSKKIFTRRAKPIRITSVRVSGVLMYLSSKLQSNTLQLIRIVLNDHLKSPILASSAANGHYLNKPNICAQYLGD